MDADNLGLTLLECCTAVDGCLLSISGVDNIPLNIEQLVYFPKLNV
jgi:hypothetical protein